MIKRVPIKAKDGYIYTNGKDFGRVIYLAEGTKKTDYTLIRLEEYEEIIKTQEENGMEI
jgi:hypothetical protein